MRYAFLPFLSLSLSLIGCAEDDPNEPTALEATSEATVFALTEGTPEALGLLAMLNDPTTTLDRLDHEVPLNRRTARNLVLHRDGWTLHRYRSSRRPASASLRLGAAVPLAG